jgi:hypothetical protein
MWTARSRRTSSVSKRDSRNPRAGALNDPFD